MDVFDSRAFDRSSLKEIPALEYWMTLAQRDHPLGKGQELLIGFTYVPINPTEFIILAISIVVSILCVSDRVP